jgi:hypothetical protein
MRSTPFKIVSSVLFFSLFAGFIGGLTTTQAQKKTESVPASSLCNQESALEIIAQQIDATRTFDDRIQRIAVLLSTADLLWPYQQEKARATFTEAFDLGEQEFKDKGDVVSREGKALFAPKPDQRFTVINAIAKRDLVWARKLMEQMLTESSSEAKDSTRNAQQDYGTAQKLLGMAISLVDSDQSAALSFAGSSLRYPGTLFLPLFLYRLAALNRPGADAFYQDALRVYANAPMEQFLYLSSYPFGNDREAGEMPGYTIYKLPDAFAPSPALQRQFVQILLQRAQQLINNPAEPAPDRALSEPGQVWLALTNLEKQIAASLPDLAPAAEQARRAAYTQLPQNAQRRVGQTIAARNAPKKSFDEQVEAAEKNPNVDKRDQQLVFALIGSESAAEILDRVLAVVDKISDSDVRQPLLNWLYFDRAQRAVKDKKLDEARKLAGNVQELDQRAHLYLRIAEESLKQNPDQNQAQEMLEEVVAAAAKAPVTMVRARVQLGVAHLYSRLDMNRAIALMGEAVKTINQMDQPDFSVQFVTRKIEGKQFWSYANFNTPGFSPETAFAELGKLDFDGMLSQASNLTSKALRVKTTLALIKPCLKAPPAPAKGKKKSKS